MLNQSSRRLFLLIFATTLLLSMSKSASACACGPRPTVLEAFEGSDEVVIVRILSVEKVEDKEDRYVHHVRSVIRIAPGETVEDINMVIPKLEETISVNGVLLYSDGNPESNMGLTSKSRRRMTKSMVMPARSNMGKPTADQDVYEAELTLPFPRCEKVKE